MAARPPPPADDGDGPGSGAATLAGAAVELTALRDAAKEELIDRLCSIRGDKGLVIDPSLTGPLGLVVDVGALKENDVSSIYHLLPGRLETNCRNVVYLARPEVANMKAIADHVHNHAAEGLDKDYYLLFVPRKTLICEKVLQEEGVLGDINVAEFSLDLIPFDDDVLSLELSGAFRECFLDGDRTSLFYVARALMKVQSLFGIIPHIMGVGNASRLVADMMLRMRAENAGSESTVTPEIDRVILLDRTIDMFSPLCTQLTYEGLIDEFFGVNNTYIDIDPELVGGTGNTTKKVKHALNSNDKLYSEIRDLNFAVIGPLLNQKAQHINEGYEERHTAQTIFEIKKFMDKFKMLQAEHKSLGIHTALAEEIMGETSKDSFHKRLEAEQNTLASIETGAVLDYVEELIGKMEPITRVLRVLCLVSLCSNGIKPKVFDYLRREIVQAYGFQHMFTLLNLEKLGLLRKSEGKATFPTLRKALRLVVDDVDEQNPQDMSYVYSGFAPLTCRLVEYATNPGWSQLGTMLALLNGPVFEETQQLPPGVLQNMAGAGVGGAGGAAGAAGGSGGRASGVTLVFFIGGVTFAEIAALRFLGSSSGEETQDYIIAATKLINGNTIMESVLAELENDLERV